MPRASRSRSCLSISRSNPAPSALSGSRIGRSVRWRAAFSNVRGRSHSPCGEVGDTRTAPLPLFLSLLFAKGITTQLDPMRVVNDAIQDGVREGGITEH